MSSQPRAKVLSAMTTQGERSLLDVVGRREVRRTINCQGT